MLKYLRYNPLDLNAWKIYRDYILDKYPGIQIHPESIIAKVHEKNAVPANLVILDMDTDLIVNPGAMYFPTLPSSSTSEITFGDLTYYREYPNTDTEYLERYGIRLAECKEIPDVTTDYYAIAVSTIREYCLLTFDCDTEEEMERIRSKVHCSPEGYLMYSSSPGKYWIITGLTCKCIEMCRLSGGIFSDWGDPKYQKISCMRQTYVLRAFERNGYIPREVEYKAGSLHLSSFRNKLAAHWTKREILHASSKH